MGMMGKTANDDLAPSAMNLTGKILISTHNLDDADVFKKSIVYICEHNKYGAIGIIVNQKISTIDFKDLLENMKVKAPTSDKEPPIFFGGPVDIERGLVLHPIEDFSSEETIKINNELGITGTIDIVKKLAVGLGPKRNIFALGYAGWGENQLEEELKGNNWLIVDADHNLLFDLEPEEKWSKALKKLGVDPASLTSLSGHS